MSDTNAAPSLTEGPIVVIHLKQDGDFDIVASEGVTICWLDEGGETPASRLFFQTRPLPRQKVIDLIAAVVARPTPEPSVPAVRPGAHLRLVSST